MDNKRRNYFDYAASCPPFLEAIQEQSRLSMELYANPSSAHSGGRLVHRIMEETRQDISTLLGIREGYLVFTSGCTEANNLAIRGVMEKYPEGRLTIAGDVHSSSWFAVSRYAGRVDILPVNSRGRIDPVMLEQAFTSSTVLCSVVHGNNETGIMHDMNILVGFCREKGVLLHCDGAQTAGHIPVDLQKIPVDFYSFSAHKFGGPRGAGGLYVRNVMPVPQIQGGAQENDMRSGTENVAGTSASLTALRLSLGQMDNERRRLSGLSKRFLEMMSDKIDGYYINSDPDEGIPGLVSLSFKGVIGTNIVAEMDLEGFSLSAGSACHSGEVSPSRVILAMGRSEEAALGTVRVSMGRFTDEEQVGQLASCLSEVVERQRALA